MHRFLNYFGYDQEADAKHRFTYIINLTSIGLVLLFSVFFLLVVKSLYVNLFTAFTLLMFLLVFPLMKNKMYMAAKIMMLLAFFIQESSIVFLWFPRESNINYFYYIVAPPISFFVSDFSILKERIYIIVANLIAVVLLVASEVYPLMNLVQISDGMIHIFSVMSVLSTILSITIIFYFYANNLSSTYKDLLTLAGTDSLTGIANRRVLFEEGKKYFSLTRRYDRSFSLMLLDIDFFKNINDTYGHPVGGDEVLVELAEVISKNIRHDDLFSRYGGEEFAVLLKDTDALSNIIVADQLQKLISKHKFHLNGEEVIALTVSVGITTYTSDFNNFDEMVVSADRALYEAKESGRNKVVVR